MADMHIIRPIITTITNCILTTSILSSSRINRDIRREDGRVRIVLPPIKRVAFIQ
jgi:hypothetical protein